MSKTKMRTLDPVATKAADKEWYKTHDHPCKNSAEGKLWWKLYQAAQEAEKCNNPNATGASVAECKSNAAEEKEKKKEEQKKKTEAYNQAMLKKAQNSAADSQHQENKDTCALMSSNSILWEQTGSKTPPEPKQGIISEMRTFWASLNMRANTPDNEKAMIAVGHASGGYEWCSGTTDEAAVLTEAGIPASETDSPSLNDIAKAVEDGKGVIVSYDTRPVWGGRYLQRTTPAGHAVRVTGVERDIDGNITALYINDTGDGVAPKRVEAATFQQALNGFGGGRMASTDAAPFSAVTKP